MEASDTATSAPKPIQFAAVARRISRERTGGAAVLVGCGICTMCRRAPQRIELTSADLVRPVPRHDGKYLLAPSDRFRTHQVDGRCEDYNQRPHSYICWGARPSDLGASRREILNHVSTTIVGFSYAARGSK